MASNPRQSVLITPLVALIGAGIAWAGSQGGASIAGTNWPILATAIAVAFLVQWIVFIPSYLLQTEKVFDLTGALTYISVTVMITVLAPSIDARALVIAALVIVWAARLGTFLFRRIAKAGSDDRFDEIKPNAMRFLNVWTIQGLWISMTALAAWIAISSELRVTLDAFAIVGALIWLTGFTIEVMADRQKSRFRADPANRGRFISTGLWSRSRHPNYFGEITLWVGILLIAAPTLRGWQWVAVLSPLFVTVLLTRVSGIPLLEKKADTKWGDDPAYQEYKASTPVLIPRLTKR